MSKVKRNSLFVALGQVLRVTMAFILIPVASRSLGDESFGRYNLATTIMFFVILIDDFGLNMWITREVAKYRDQARYYFTYAVGLKFVLILVCLVFLGLVTIIFPYDQETVRAIWIFSIYAVLTSFRDLAVALFRAFEEMSWAALVLSVERVLVAVFGIAVLIRGWGLKALAWAFVAAAVISLLLSALIVIRKIGTLRAAFSLQEFKIMIKAASFFGLSLFLTTVYSRLDMLILSVMKGPAVWGWYAAAHKLIDLTNIVPNVLMIATFPAFARMSVASIDQLSYAFTRGVKYLFILALPMIPGIVILSGKIILLINGPEFLNAVPALQILAITAGILFVNIFLAGLFGATNNQGKLLIIQICGLLLNGTLNFILIPNLAHVGAAIATVITEFIVLLVSLQYALRKIVRLHESKFFYEVLLATLTMSVGLWFLKDINLFLCISICIALYFGLLLLRGTITINEILTLKRPVK